MPGVMWAGQNPLLHPTGAASRVSRGSKSLPGAPAGELVVRPQIPEAFIEGLHFSCGEWMGDDKSANPLFDIIPKVLSKYVAYNELADWERFLIAFNEQAESEALELTPEMMRAIIAPLGRYRDALVKKLGLSGPDASLEELGGCPRVPSKEELRLGCVRDLLVGNEECQRTQEPIRVIFA